MSVRARRLLIRRALLLLALLALASPLRAERLILKSYTTADGLAHDWVNCVVEDARGFLWFCTDDGVSRFDGYGFTNYGIGDGLPSARVNAILPAPDGRHWIATSAGLIRFDPHGTQATDRAEPGRSAASRESSTAPAPMFSAVVSGLEGRARYVTSLLKDRAGVVWVGTHDGLYRMTIGQGEDIRLAAVDVGIPDRGNLREINCLMEDRRGALWIGTMQDLYRRSADGRVEQIVPSARADLLTIHALLEDRDGRVWVGTRYGGVFQLTIDTASQRATVTRVYAAPRDLRTNWITTIVQSADGAVWVGSNLGVFHFLPDSSGDGYRIRAYSSTSEGVDEVWAIAEDRQHNLWLGRRPGGVGKLWHRGLTRFDAADGLSWANSINATPKRRPDRGRRARWERLVSVPLRRKEVHRREISGAGCVYGMGMESDGPAGPDRRLVDRDRPWTVPVHEPRDHRRCQSNVAVRDLHDPRRSCCPPGVPPVRGLERRRVDRDGRRCPSRAVALAAEDPHLPALHRRGWPPAPRPVVRRVLCRGSGGTRVDRLRRARRPGAPSRGALRAFHHG